jgi:hypothetical protein
VVEEILVDLNRVERLNRVVTLEQNLEQNLERLGPAPARLGALRPGGESRPSQPA